MSVFHGTCTAMLTPFTQTGVNFSCLQQMIRHQLKNGTDALLVCGTTGEPSTMTEQEKREVLRFTVQEVQKRIPVIASTGGNNTARCVEESRLAESIGADALLVVTPYYNKATQNGLIAHYTAIANAVSVPILLYNVPARTGVNLLPQTVAELAKHPNICGIKEASGNISQICELTRLVPNFDLYSGDDGITLPILSLGGKGVISVVGNVAPRLMHDFLHAVSAQEALRLQHIVKEIANALFCEVNPIPVKEACRLVGFPCGIPRLPLTPPETEHAEYIRKTIEKYREVLSV